MTTIKDCICVGVKREPVLVRLADLFRRRPLRPAIIVRVGTISADGVVADWVFSGKSRYSIEVSSLDEDSYIKTIAGHDIDSLKTACGVTDPAITKITGATNIIHIAVE